MDSLFKRKNERMGEKEMATVRVIEVHENVFNTNNLAANELSERLSEKKVTMLNVMSSPGSGKTTLLSDVINRIKDRYKIGVMDVDIETSLPHFSVIY